MATQYQYKVETVVEGWAGTIILGSSGLPVKKLEALLNQRAGEGWDMIFQAIEKKRMWLFWQREAVIVTFRRQV